MFAQPTGSVGWYLWQIKTTHLLPASILTIAALMRNLFVGILTPIYVARLITHFDSYEQAQDVIRLIAIVVLAGMAEVVSLGMKQTVNYGVRRALLETLADLSKTTYLPWARFNGSITGAVDDFFSSLKEIMSALFTQVPVLTVGFGGLIVVAFLNGMVVMGIIALILAILAPFIMYATTKKVRRALSVLLLPNAMNAPCSKQSLKTST